MDSVELLSLVADAIDGVVPLVLLVASIVTLSGNYAAKRFFGACGLGLRERYLGAAVLGTVGLAFLVGFSKPSASTAMIAMLLILAALALRAGSKRESAASAAFATLLAAAEIGA